MIGEERFESRDARVGAVVGAAAVVAAVVEHEEGTARLGHERRDW